MRPGRSELLGLLDPLAELVQHLLSEQTARLGEQLVLLLLDVVPDALHQHLELRVVPLVLGAHLLQLGERPLHHVVLLERFQHRLARLLEATYGGLERRGTYGRVEEHLFHRGVDGELADDLVDDLLLRLVGALRQLLEFLEELLHFLVIALQEGDGVHSGNLLHAQCASAVRHARPPGWNAVAPLTSASPARRRRGAIARTSGRRS